MSLHKRFTQKCAKLVDEKYNRLFCCVSVRDFESKILIKGVHQTNKMLDGKWFFFLWIKVCILWIQKKRCHRTTFYSIINMGSCRKPEIQNDLPKITKIKWICYF